MAQVFHGSDLEKIEEIYGIKKEDIVSFSANVNPLGISEKLKQHIVSHVNAIESYPDRNYEDLRAEICEYAGADKDDIRVGSGATELISSVIEATGPASVLMVTPTYSEYSRKLSQNGTEIKGYMLNKSKDFAPDTDDFIKEVRKGYDMIMICNPNNPTGSAFTNKELSEICDASGGVVLVDETYVEFAADVDEISAVKIVPDHKNLVVLRGTSKFFSSPGLRLGYMVCSDGGLKEKIAEKSDPWSVNSIAAVSGGEMFKDSDYIKRTRDFVSSEMARLVSELKKLDVHVYEPKANFVLMRILKDGVKSFDVFERCIKKGLMIRDCSSFEGLGTDHIRVCLGTKEQNDRLLEALVEILR